MRHGHPLDATGEVDRPGHAIGIVAADALDHRFLGRGKIFVPTELLEHPIGEFGVAVLPNAVAVDALTTQRGHTFEEQEAPGDQHQQLHAAEKFRDSLFGLVQCLTAAIDAKDPYTRGHSERVARYSSAIAKEMGLPADEARKVVGEWPAYRVSTTHVMTMQHRLLDCYWQMRLPLVDYGSDVTVALTMYLVNQAKGGEITAPTIKR